MFAGTDFIYLDTLSISATSHQRLGAIALLASFAHKTRWTPEILRNPTLFLAALQRTETLKILQCGNIVVGKRSIKTPLQYFNCVLVIYFSIGR